jgi:DNA-binding response OmpR family regulator
MQGFWMGLDTRPDVIITDLEMPDGQGNYILSRFKSHSLTKGTPIIVLTGESSPAMKRQMLSLGASAYFIKPIRWDAMLDELGRHIELTPCEALP